MYYFHMGSVLLPIPPEKMTLKIKNQNKTMTLINDSEVNLLKDAGLTEIEFDVLIPAVLHPFAVYENDFKPLPFYLDHFENLKVSKKPFEFKVVRSMPDETWMFNTSMTVSLEQYTVTEQANEGFDSKVSIKLKQYKQFGTKIVKVATDEKSGDTTATIEKQRETENSPAPKQETTYTVKSGDTLSNIAKSIYGDGSKWAVIYEANKDKITNPNLIYAGQVLVIPNVSGGLATNTVASPTVSPTGNPTRVPTTPTPTKPTENQKKVINTNDGQTCTLAINIKRSYSADQYVGGKVTVRYHRSDIDREYSETFTKVGTHTVTLPKDSTAYVSIAPNRGYEFKTYGFAGFWSLGTNTHTCKVNKKNCSITVEWMIKR